MEYVFFAIVAIAVIRVLYVDYKGHKYRITELADRHGSKYIVEIQGAFLWHKCGPDGKAIYGHNKPALEFSSLTEARSVIRTFKSKRTIHHQCDEL